MISYRQWQRLRWERDTRYYDALLHQDLWGRWVLTRVWGRKGTRLGRVVHQLFASYEEALKGMEAVRLRREKRRYVSVTMPSLAS